MRVQDSVLNFLEQHRGDYVSGEAIAEALGVSRNAVWKAIQKLGEEGHVIDSKHRRGYALSDKSSLLTAEGIRKQLKTAHAVTLEVMREVDSTNNAAKKMAESGTEEGVIVIAETQTAGKGRLGRRFCSPLGTGLYMSFVLRPKCTAERALFITTAAAVAVCEAIEQVSGLQPEIKWVNDVYLNEKKICGILTEAAVDFESGGLSYAVLGIGINVLEPEGGFPEEIRSIAGALYRADCPVGLRQTLCAAVIDRFFAHYGEVETGAFIEAYRSRSFLTGREIVFSLGNAQYSGVVTGISDEAHLLVRLENGEERAFSAGEVQLHKGFKNREGQS